jgi:hypothetical protein
MLLPPQLVPSGKLPVVAQRGSPEPHTVERVWQGSGGGTAAWPGAPSQAAPTSQAPQEPVRQTMPEPQLVPSVSTVPRSWQTAAPVLQAVLPA